MSKSKKTKPEYTYTGINDGGIKKRIVVSASDMILTEFSPKQERHHIVPVKTNLFFNYYTDPTRQHEIDYCLKQNEKVFDRVIIVQGRPTFNELFELTKSYPNDINCFCNSDIYFTDTEILKSIKENECYALSRWDLQKDGSIKHFNRRDSFDSYVFRGAIKIVNDCNFTMGIAGCDDSIAERIQRAGYDVKNPSLDIKTVHYHLTGIRTYNPKQPTPKPYLLIQPHTLNETNIIKTILE